VIRGLFLTDTHLRHGQDEHPAYSAVKAFAKAWKPDLTLHGGDIGDWDFISVFNKDNLKALSGKTFKAEYELINREVDYWQSVSKQFVLLLGNHDERVYTAAEKAPMLEGLIEPEFVIMPVERGIKMFRRTEQPYRVGKLAFLHGWYYSKYHCTRHLDAYSGNIVYGHVHDFSCASKTLVAHGQEIQAWSIGCLCDLAPEYKEGMPSGWQHGFAAFYIRDNGDFSLYPVNIVRSRFTFEGKTWGPKGLERK